MSTAGPTRRAKPAKAGGGGKAGAVVGAGAAAAAKPVPPVLPVWRRLLLRNLEWKPDEVLTALHWVRQAYGVGVGLLFGLVGVTGGVAAIVYILSCFALTTGYFRVYLGVDEEDLADAPDGGSLQTEGLFSSVALFVLTWTLSYSLVHAAA